MSQKTQVVVGRTPALPANPPGLRMPLPQGRVQVQNLTPLEKQRLESLGLAGVTEIPENFAELSETALRAAGRQASAALLAEVAAETDSQLLDELQSRVGAGFQSLKAPTEVDISTLPPDQRKVYEQLLQKMVSNRAATRPVTDLSQLSPSVAAAVSQLDEPTITDDRKQANYASGAAKVAAEPPAVSQPAAAAGNCARCGHPKDHDYDIPITEAEKDAYLACILCLRPYEATESLFGGRLRLRLRSLSAADLDAIWRQIMWDEQAGRIVNVADKLEFSQRYRLTLSLLSFETPEALYTFPGSLADWQPGISEDGGKVYACWQSLSQTLSLNESLLRVLNGAVMRFYLRLSKLENLADDPNFYKAGDPS